MADETKTMNEGPKGMYGLKVGAGVFEVNSQMSIRFHTALTLLAGMVNELPYRFRSDHGTLIDDAFKLADEFIARSGEA